MTELTADQQELLSQTRLGAGDHRMEYKIREQAFGGSPEAYVKAGNKLCIMEAVSVIQGHGVSYSPPCVSKVILEYMIAWNDSTDSQTREKMKELVPEIIHTAPTRVAQDIESGPSWVVRDWGDPKYQRLEEERLKTLGKVKRILTTAQQFKLVRELAAMGKFDAS